MDRLLFLFFYLHSLNTHFASHTYIPSLSSTTSSKIAMASYDIPTYLLDRANIHDTVTKMSLLLDLKKWAQIGEEVFAETLLVDYTSLLGGEPYTITGVKQAETWEHQLRALDAWQHVTT